MARFTSCIERKEKEDVRGKTYIDLVIAAILSSLYECVKHCSRAANARAMEPELA